MIPLARPRVPASAMEGFAALLASGMLVEGARTAAFAGGLAAYTGSRHAILVNSGTSALYLGLKALGIGPGHAVLVPAYTFPATANAVAWAGAEPIFTDVNPATFNMDAASVAAALDRIKPAARKRIKAVMPVQAFGNPVDMGPLLRMAKREGWKVIEDAACALGSTYEGAACGTHGHLGCFSFHPRKILTTGEGGAVITGSAALAKSISSMKNHGMIRKGGRMAFLEPGLNLRFNEAAAVLGEAQLAVFEETLDERRGLATLYAEGLHRLGIPLQEPVPGGEPNWQAMVVRVPTLTDRSLDALVAGLAADGVQASIGTYLVPGQKAFPVKRLAEHFPHALKLARQGLALPLYAGMGGETVDQVVATLGKSL